MKNSNVFYTATAVFVVVFATACRCQKLSGIDAAACGAKKPHFLTESSGEIFSPGFQDGKNYSNNLDCTYIFPARIGQVVQFSVIFLDLESSDQCDGDQIQIVDERATLKVMCGSHIPYNFTSQSERVMLIFQTDFMITGRGFHISYTIMNSRDICGPRNYKCQNDKCVPTKSLCNGVQDCGDGSDESMCPKGKHQNVVCGSTPIAPDLSIGNDRIVGGREVIPGSWPWQADLQLLLVTPSGHSCGGTLINDQWVLTAAHCFGGAPHYSHWRVVLGNHHKFETDKQAQIRGLDRFYVYGYSEQEFLDSGGRFSTAHDIAIMKLNAPIKFSDFVQPACLPPKGYEVKPGTKCYATGWGATRGTGANHALKQTEMIIEDMSYCESYLMLTNNKTMVCAGNRKGQHGLCFGDSGGPLVCQDGKKWYLIGISSFVTEHNILEGVCAVPNRPSGFTKVATRLDWINSALLSDY